MQWRTQKCSMAGDFMTYEQGAESELHNNLTVLCGWAHRVVPQRSTTLWLDYNSMRLITD